MGCKFYVACETNNKTIYSYVLITLNLQLKQNTNANIIPMINICQQYYVRPFTWIKCIIYMLHKNKKTRLTYKNFSGSFLVKNSNLKQDFSQTQISFHKAKGDKQRNLKVLGAKHFDSICSGRKIFGLV